MTTEFDLSCSECDGQLRRVHAPASDHIDGVDGTISLAECANCGAQYYPKRVLDQM